VGELNAMVADRSVRDFIRVAETHQARKLSDIASQIHEMRESVRAVLIAGPSSSGQTAFH